MTDISKNITSGTVSIEDGVKAKEEFAPARKVKIELSFGVPENADGVHFLNGVSQVAENKVAEMLGLPPKFNGILTASEIIVTKELVYKKAPAETVKQKAPTKPKPVEKTKADLEAEMLAEAAKPAEKPSVSVEHEDETPADDDDNDDLNDILGEAAPAPITDKELSDACVAKADKMKSVTGWEPKRIRALIEKFTGAPGKHNREIPAAKRPEFLKELDALK